MGRLDIVKEKVADLLFPRRCPLCGALINSNERICSKCSKDVEFIRRPICRICGRPLYSCNCRKGEYAFVEDYLNRGYNQAVLLAKTVSEETEIPLISKAIIKTQKTRPQHTLSFIERRRNLEGAFRVVRPEMIRGKTVLLCDDVTTSGNTLNECSLSLLEAGAKAVYCVTATVAVMSEMPAIKSAAFGTGW